MPGRPLGRAQEGSPSRTLCPCRIPPKGGEGEGRRGRGSRKGGHCPPSLVLFGLQGGGLPWPPSSLSAKAHGGPLVPRGVPVTPLALRFYPTLPGTLPMSE
mgnify:CR=1 FL=1